MACLLRVSSPSTETLHPQSLVPRPLPPDLAATHHCSLSPGIGLSWTPRRNGTRHRAVSSLRVLCSWSPRAVARRRPSFLSGAEPYPAGAGGALLPSTDTGAGATCCCRDHRYTGTCLRPLRRPSGCARRRGTAGSCRSSVFDELRDGLAPAVAAQACELPSLQRGQATLGTCACPFKGESGQVIVGRSRGFLQKLPVSLRVRASVPPVLCRPPPIPVMALPPPPPQ